jgi:hypothetical protein
MTRTSAISRGAAIALVAASLALSCATVDKAGAPPADDKLVARGQSAWNSKGPEAAAEAWSALQDGATRKTYMGYVQAYSGMLADLDAAAAAAGSDEAKAFNDPYGRAAKAYSSFPAELKLPPEAGAKGARAAADRARALLDARKSPQARELAQSAVSAFGDSGELASLLGEAEALIAEQKGEAEADAALDRARGRQDFDARIEGSEAAIAAYAKVYASLADRAGSAGSKAVAGAEARLEKKRQDARIEIERRLREREYSFKERIGEEFARVPEGDKLGSMSLEEILAYQEGIKANVEKAYEEMREFGERYPAVIDRGMMRDVEAQKAALEARMAQVAAEIRTAKDIASRGKTVMPVMIGLFNPQPGGKGDDQRSRPAAFRGTSRGGSEYWWGMAAIPKGGLNDLVVSVSGDRGVRVFAENTKSGARVGEKGVKDIVNKAYKVGNMWPVLNAGSQLPSGNYYFEVQDGKKAEYEGEVVIYSSFIARMR